jgi:thiamine transport system ATP-binding protein
VLEISGLTVAYGDDVVLEDLSLEVRAHQILAVHGPSGCGKSTLLGAIAGITPVRAGRIVLDGDDLTGTATHRRGIAMVFQDDQLFPHRNVVDNVAFAPQVAGMSRRARRRVAEDLLGIVGLDGLAHRRVQQLSGGEAKRVAVARALAAQPRLLLLDEPLSGLDPDLHDRLADQLVGILQRTGTTAIWVTHDRAEARRVADRTIELS